MLNSYDVNDVIFYSTGTNKPKNISNQDNPAIATKTLLET